MTRPLPAQHSLDTLYFPPPMHTGRLYAYMGKGLIMAISFAPLCPSGSWLKEAPSLGMAALG